MKLYPYQTKYLQGLPKNVMMTCDVGLGKSAMALRHYEKYSHGKQLIIVAPASKVRSGDWEQEIEDWLLLGPGEYMVISYERFTKYIDNILGGAKDMAFIFDEVHYAKAYNSQRGKAFVKAVKACHQWIGLTATPMSNGWHDVCNYAIATGLVKNKSRFYTAFVMMQMQRMGFRQFPKIVGYQNVETLSKWWAKVSKPLSREGNLDLPKFIDKRHYIKMDEETKREQLRLLKERTALDGEMLDSAPKLIAALRKNIVQCREDALRNIFDATDENIVIFYNLNAERDLVKKVLRDYKHKTLYEQNGHAKTLPVRGSEPTKDGVLLIQYQSGAAGLNLQYCSVTIFMSPTYSYQNYHQARGRTDRNGQTRTPVFYHLEVNSSIDQLVWKSLQQKKDFSENSVDISRLEA